ncbi:unnamed protein product [Tuwongella immobilis]|uniref:Uncharacterized protein n=2 Tax=Tuwongella immobilis TaxID=692036 RepID=A0A6C2YQQ3_9BACT|nr:unnamed protein product [Tuwongella immobilis]VTS05323.1 unnamed protein product [Tuwongella immobilis]
MFGQLINVQNPIETQGYGNGAGEGWEDIGETPQSPNEEFTMDGTSTRRDFLVPWPERLSFTRSMLGYPFMGDDGLMYRNLPAAHPEYYDIDNEPYLFATKVSLSPLAFRGLNKDAFLFGEAVAKHELARMTVTYESLPYRVLFRSKCLVTETINNQAVTRVDESKRFVRKLSKSAGEFLTSETGQWIWWDEGERGADGKSKRYPKLDGQPVATRIGIWQGLRQIAHTWFDVHPKGWDRERAENLIGTTNDRPFDGCERETLMLTAVNVVPRQSPIGIPLDEVTFEFLHKATGINRYLHPIGEYFTVIAKFPNLPAPLSQEQIDAGQLGGIRKPIFPADLSVIWQPPAQPAGPP